MHLLVSLPYLISLIHNQELFKINKINVYNIHKNADKKILKTKLLKYHIFSNLIRTLFTVSESWKIRCRLDSRSSAGFWKNDRATVHAIRTIQYNNLLLYLLFIILHNIYNLLFIRLAVITHNWISLPCRQGTVEGKVRIRTANKLFFRLRNWQKLVWIRFDNIRYVSFKWIWNTSKKQFFIFL